MTSITVASLDKQIELKKELYREEIQKFQKAGEQFLSKEITNPQFKASSGGMGVYAERSGTEFMIRLRILSGILDLDSLKLVQTFAHDYAMDFIHFTTRQTIQLHNLKFEHVIEIMERSLDHNIITRGGGGNFPRNVAISPLSGVAAEEAFDVTPYAILVNKYFLSQMNTYHLPRKFKVSFSSHTSDSANASISDVGFIATAKEGKEYFKLFLGGSLGANGDISVPYEQLIPASEILYHIEALLSLFKEEGDYENKPKARIRFIVKRMGSAAFLECYRQHLANVKETLDLSFMLSDSDTYGTDTSVLKYETENIKQEITSSVDTVNDMTAYKDVIPQKQKDLYTVIIHPQGGILKRIDLDRLVSFLEMHTNGQARISMEESLYIRNLTSTEAIELLGLTEHVRSTTRLSRSVSCIGVPICQIGIQSSQGLLESVLDYFKVKGFQDDILPSIHISGCVNSCARHQVSEIGFQGKKKRVDNETKDAYALFIGGQVGNEGAVLAKEYGDILAQNIPKFLYELASILKEKNIAFSEFVTGNQDGLQTLLAAYLV